MAGRIALVDAHNRFIRWTDRAEIHAHHLPHRSTQVLIFDSAGRLVIQRRHRDKLTHANYWDISSSGHVEEEDYLGGPDERLAEVYAAVARREVREELGIEAELTFLGAFGPASGIHYEQLHLFTGHHDGPYTAQAEEVEELRAVTLAELEAMADDMDELVTPNLVFFARWARDRGMYGTP